MDRRKANSLYRRFYLDKNPPAQEVPTQAFAELVFQRTHDFLAPDDPTKLESSFGAITDAIPFNLDSAEREELRTVTATAVASALKASGDFVPETEEELEMELEQEAEMQVERLRNEENFGESSFTNNPLQWPPMYAYCDEAAVATARAPNQPQFHPCAQSARACGAAPARPGPGVPAAVPPRMSSPRWPSHSCGPPRSLPNIMRSSNG